MMFPRSNLRAEIRKSRKEHGLDKPDKVTARAVLPYNFTVEKKIATSKAEAKKKWLEYFKKNDWKPLPFQKECWEWFEKGADIIISILTGSGKTLAAYGGPFIQSACDPKNCLGYKIIYITPLRALVRDIQISLAKVSESTGIPIYIEGRSGDLKIKAAEKKYHPQVLVCTPESLSIMLARKNAGDIFSHIKTVIVDEAHEIFASKRGSLLELDLAFLRTFSKTYQSIVVSATIANPFEIANKVNPRRDYKLVDNAILKETRIRLLNSSAGSPLGYFGFAGIRNATAVIKNLSLETSRILFTNTRAQAEVWYNTLQSLNQDNYFKIALHHSSIDRAVRMQIEDELKAGKLHLIISTSSLELGVDFPAVESVFQVGSSKKVTRAIQRGGRGFHSPGKISELIVIPTSIFDVFEIAALNRLIVSGRLEPVLCPVMPLDVLTQYLQTKAIHAGFTIQEIKNLLNNTATFSNVTEETIQIIIQFLEKGGTALSVYPNFKKIALEEDRYQFTDKKIAQRHLYNIGTIVDSSSVRVKYLTGGYIGQIDEMFVARLKKGDIFSFAGKNLEYVNLREMVLNTRLVKKEPDHISVWSGTPISISALLATEMVETLPFFCEKKIMENDYWAKILQLQSKLSGIPKQNEILIERVKTRAGFHTFLFLFEGRLSHEGIGHLLTYRFSRNNPSTFSVTCSDYGIELLSSNYFPSDHDIINAFKDFENLTTDIINTFNFPELSKRKFREIAAISGMVYQRMPGRDGANRHLQLGTGVLFDVLKKYDPEHPLIRQAESEVLETQLDMRRIEKAFKRFNQSRFLFFNCEVLTPFSFPIYLERVSSRISTELLEDRILRLQEKILKVAHARRSKK